MGFKIITEGYYLVPIADIETLVSLNECTSCYCSCGDCGDLDRVIQRIAKTKQRVKLTTTRPLSNYPELVSDELDFLD
mgnify:CR=1 FL=1